MNRKKILIGVASLVVILIIAAIIKKKYDVDAIEVETDQAKIGKVTEMVTANGKVQPEVEVKISAEVSGEIIKLPVKEGDTVKKGDLLVEINPDIFLSTVQRMEAGLNTTKANLANAKARLAQVKAQFLNAKVSFERNKTLFDKKAISQADYDAASTSFEVAKADVEAAEQSVIAAEYNVKSSQAAVNEARDNLKRTSIFSPMNGTVSSLRVEEGERVVGTAQMTGTEIMRVSDLRNMEVSVEVNESDIIRVTLNDTTDIEVDAYLDRTFKGIVTEIANSATSLDMISSDQVTSFDVKIRILHSSYEDLMKLDNPHYSPFRPGMSASVEIKTEKKIDVLTVPIQAVTLREDTLESENDEEDNMIECVFVIEDDKAILTPVKTGIQDNKNIVILSGLTDGQKLVSGPYSVVSKELENEDVVEEKSEEDEDDAPWKK